MTQGSLPRVTMGGGTRTWWRDKDRVKETKTLGRRRVEVVCFDKDTSNLCQRSDDVRWFYWIDCMCPND